MSTTKPGDNNTPAGPAADVGNGNGAASHGSSSPSSGRGSFLGVTFNRRPEFLSVGGMPSTLTNPLPISQLIVCVLTLSMKRSQVC
jgi:hypothetical protein